MSAAIRLATQFPFKTGEAVFFLPNSTPHKQATPYIPATVLEVPAMPEHRWETIRVQRDDKPRSNRLRCLALAYRGYCPACLVPAIDDAGALRCPSCGDWALDEPPPDVLTVRWFPMDCWHTSMRIRRAFEHPDWTYGQVCDDVSATVNGSYDAMLARLELLRPEMRSTKEIYGWMADYRDIQRLVMCAIQSDDAAFCATYQELKQSQAAPHPKDREEARIIELIATMKKILADEDDEADLPGRSTDRPLAITRPADDAQPDGADDLTRWIDGQFGRAA